MRAPIRINGTSVATLYHVSLFKNQDFGLAPISSHYKCYISFLLIYLSMVQTLKHKICMILLDLVIFLQKLENK